MDDSSVLSELDGDSQTAVRDAIEEGEWKHTSHEVCRTVCSDVDVVIWSTVHISCRDRLEEVLRDDDSDPKLSAVQPVPGWGAERP